MGRVPHAAIPTRLAARIGRHVPRLDFAGVVPALLRHQQRQSTSVQSVRWLPFCEASKMLQHCWHDVNVKFPGGRLKTVNVPTRDGRVCCYCGEIRTEPLPPMRPKRAHGPHVDDDSEWYVVDDAECPGLGLVELNPEPAVVADPPKQ